MERTEEQKEVRRADYRRWYQLHKKDVQLQELERRKDPAYVERKKDIKRRSAAKHKEQKEARRLERRKDPKILERDRKRNREWAAAHKDQQKQYADAHKEEKKRDKRKYKLSLRGRMAMGKYASKIRDISWELTLEEYKSIVTDAVCHFCQQALPLAGYGLDRKDNEPSYRVDNVVPCCDRCNKTFGDRFNYDEKLLLAVTIKHIDELRPFQEEIEYTERQCRNKKTSQYRGVSWCNTRTNWNAAIAKNKVGHTIGGFDSEIDAALAYDRAAKVLHGDKARLNFPYQMDAFI